MPFIKRKFYIENEIPAFLWLMREFNFTQAEAQRVIDRGRLLCGGKTLADKAIKIKGDIEVIYFEPKTKGNNPILTTPDFFVFEKPSGVLVHPKKMTSPYSMLDEVRYFGGNRANSVHRIDKETSGLLLASRHKEAERFLKGAFEKKFIQKSYRAWAVGKIDRAFSVDAPIILNNDYSKTKHKVFIDENGKRAYTTFLPIYYDKDLDASLLECIPHTGRTHQIRIHLYHIKHPILGDPLYGTTFEIATQYLEERLSIEERASFTGASRLMLHAYSLDFRFKNRWIIKSINDFKEAKRYITPPSKRLFYARSGFRV